MLYSISKLVKRGVQEVVGVFFFSSVGGQTYISETVRNLEVRVNEHLDVNKQSETAKHIRKHPNHKFTWEVLTTDHSW